MRRHYPAEVPRRNFRILQDTGRTPIIGSCTSLAGHSNKARSGCSLPSSRGRSPSTARSLPATSRSPCSHSPSSESLSGSPGSSRSEVARTFALRRCPISRCQRQGGTRLVPLSAHLLRDGTWRGWRGCSAVRRRCSTTTTGTREGRARSPHRRTVPSATPAPAGDMGLPVHPAAGPWGSEDARRARRLTPRVLAQPASLLEGASRVRDGVVVRARHDEPIVLRAHRPNAAASAHPIRERTGRPRADRPNSPHSKNAQSKGRGSPRTPGCGQGAPMVDRVRLSRRQEGA